MTRPDPQSLRETQRAVNREFWQLIDRRKDREAKWKASADFRAALARDIAAGMGA
jgi:hypothetical protein